jgi:putative membrane protein
MNATSIETHAPTPNELAQERTDLALERTLMAADRSLMAWVRTSLSMTSFGFTIYKLLQGFEHSGGVAIRDNSPRAIGLFLTALGTVAMVMGSIEYWYRLKKLRAQHGFRILQPSFVMALVMSATGLALFIGIISKVL